MTMQDDFAKAPAPELTLTPTPVAPAPVEAEVELVVPQDAGGEMDAKAAEDALSPEEDRKSVV